MLEFHSTLASRNFTFDAALYFGVPQTIDQTDHRIHQFWFHLPSCIGISDLNELCA